MRRLRSGGEKKGGRRQLSLFSLLYLMSVSRAKNERQVPELRSGESPDLLIDGSGKKGKKKRVFFLPLRCEMGGERKRGGVGIPSTRPGCPARAVLWEQPEEKERKAASRGCVFLVLVPG